MPNQVNKLINSTRPLVGTWRGEVLECVQSGAIAVADTLGNLIASAGDPQLVTYLRSSAKPFQALPFVEAGGVEHFGLTREELAILCASHDGTDQHVTVLQSIQKKVGINEQNLQCGVHPPYSKSALRQLILRAETPTPNRHNCSGKHTGMLAMCVLMGWPLENYLDPQHPLQQLILKTFSEMTGTPIEEIDLGTDGCSAPVFAVSLQSAAVGFARLADPSGLAPARAEACRKITSAMTAFPEMISGPGGFDTSLMQAGKDKIICKSGAEGYLAIGLLPGARGTDSKALGIAVKVLDGDTGGSFRPGADTNEGRARPIAGLETLRQLGALSPEQMKSMAGFGARLQTNWRGIDVGRSEPVFNLTFPSLYKGK
jgi:L-asparaginase II